MFARQLILRNSAMSGYEQPPIHLGKGGKPGKMPTDEDQATGREREELASLEKGIEHFNRHPIQMQKGQGTFENPVLVPSEMHDRIVGMVPKVSLCFSTFFFLFRFPSQKMIN
jgi:cytochrome c oxidase subunit 5b